MNKCLIIKTLWYSIQRWNNILLFNKFPAYFLSISCHPMMIFSRFNFDLTKWFSRGKRVNEPKFSKARICIIGEPSRCGIAKLHLFERPPRIRGEDAPGGRAICIVARRCSPLLNFFRKFPNVPSNNLILLSLN